MESLYDTERLLRGQGVGRICGIDEAGRGPLAGPVVAAAVALPEDLVIAGLNDSKKLSEKKREALYEIITARADWAVGMADEREIDALNILQATFLAMRRALAALSAPAEYALVDGNRDPLLGIPTLTVVEGDGKIACIAAASIIAKVTRDRMMARLDAQYPNYGFARHKGYPTKAHYAAIAQWGAAPVHRRSFLKGG